MTNDDFAAPTNREYSQCWDCHHTEFRLFRRDGELMAECEGCGGVQNANNLYQPEPTEPEDYDMEMMTNA